MNKYEEKIISLLDDKVIIKRERDQVFYVERVNNDIQLHRMPAWDNLFKFIDNGKYMVVKNIRGMYNV